MAPPEMAMLKPIWINPLTTENFARHLDARSSATWDE
jgi:hypothetical protein